MFWKILKQAVFTNILPEEPGTRYCYEFWPRWDPRKTGNTSYVEPDVFIRFRDFDIIIEAKRHENNQQYRTQWEK